jgi:hypothetical protein
MLHWSDQYAVQSPDDGDWASKYEVANATPVTPKLAPQPAMDARLNSGGVASAEAHGYSGLFDYNKEPDSHIAPSANFLPSQASAPNVPEPAIQPPPETNFGENLVHGAVVGWQNTAPVRLGGNKTAAHFSAPAEGVGGIIGETAAGLPGGFINPENAAENVLATITGAKSVEVAAPLLKRVAGVAGPRVANALSHFIGGASGGGGLSAMQKASQITPEQWAADPWGSLTEVIKSGGTGALIAGGTGTLIGGASKKFEAPVSKAVPEQVGGMFGFKPDTSVTNTAPILRDKVVQDTANLRAEQEAARNRPQTERAADVEQAGQAASENPELFKAPEQNASPQERAAVDRSMGLDADTVSKEDILDNYVGKNVDKGAMAMVLKDEPGDFVRTTVTPDDFNDIPRSNLDIDRAAKYSKLDTPAPPVVATMGEDGNLQIRDGRHRLLAAALRDQATVGDPYGAQVEAIVPRRWVEARDGLTPSESPRPPVAQPAGIPVERNIKDAMGAAALGSMPSVQSNGWMARGVAGLRSGLNKLGQKIGGTKDMLGSIAGEAFPTHARLDRASAEAGVHIRTANEYAEARGNEVHEAMIRAAREAGDSSRADAIDTANKAWAVLTEDNLRDLRNQKNASGDTEGAKQVRSLIGTAAPGIGSEAEFQAALRDPKVKAAIDAYAEYRPELEEKFQQGQGKTVAASPPTRGESTGVRINLLAKLDSDLNPVNQPPPSGTGTRSGGLKNPLQRKPRTSREASGTAGAYNVNALEGLQHSFKSVTEPAAKREYTAALEKAGLAEIHRGYDNPVEGRKAIEIEPAKPAMDAEGKAVLDKEGRPIMVQPKVMYPDPRIYSEVRGIYNLNEPVKIPVITSLLRSHTGASLIGLGEAVYHTGTLLSGVQRAFNMKHSPAGALFNSGLIRLGRSMAVVGQEALNAFRKTPESLAMKSERVRVGAGRPKAPTNLPGTWYIHTLHEAVGAAIQKMVHEAADMGKIPKTETAIRDAITKNIGQYNHGLKGQLTQILQDTGTAPYLGTQKAQLGLLGRFITGGTGVKGAAQSLRLNHFMNLAGSLIQVGAASYFLSGHFFGRPGVPIGDIDTGKNDKNGNPITIPTTFLFGNTAFKRSGLQKVVTGLRDGRDKGLIAEDTYNEIVRNVTRLAGPGVKSGFSLMTGKALDPALFDITPAPEDDESPQFLENAKAVAAQINPGATKAAAQGVRALGFPDTARQMERYAGHPEESVAESQLKALMPSGVNPPNDEARMAARRKENQKKRAREARKE